MNNTANNRYLVASDFDQTLSFSDSGYVLADIIGVKDFGEKVKGLANTYLVQQGAELAYLLRHDPAFRGVRHKHLVEAGQRVRLKDGVALLVNILTEKLDNSTFQFVVISAGPRELVQSALKGVVPPDNIYGAEFNYDPSTEEISAINIVPAGYGKVAVLSELEVKFGTNPDHTVYIGDGSSDLYVMQHVNSCEGHSIAVSKSKDIGRIAQRTVLSDNAASVLVPIFEDILMWDSHQIRDIFEKHGLSLQGWDKIRTDWVTFHNNTPPSGRET